MRDSDGGGRRPAANDSRMDRITRIGGEADRPAPTVRGLRLASSEPEVADEPPATPPGDDEPPEPGAPGSGRPSLKRVK